MIASTGVILGGILLTSGNTDGGRLMLFLLLWAVSLLPRTRTQRLVVGVRVPGLDRAIALAGEPNAG